MVKRLIRALKTLPRQTWWAIALPLAFLALLAMDRHLAATGFLAWVGYRALTVQRRKRTCSTRRVKHKLRWVNPSTGLPMFLNDVGGVDSAGHYYGEDTLPYHRRDNR